MRHDWTVAEVEALFALPFADLMFRAQDTHRANHDPNAVQTRDPAVDQDRRLPRGLRVLSAERALRHRPRARDAGAARRSPHTRAGREGCRRDPLLHGRGLALTEEARRRSRRRNDPRSARARHGDLRHARHAQHRSGAGTEGRRASTTTTTTSTRARSSTARSSPRAPTRIVSTHWPRCARPDSMSAVAASSAWAKRCAIAPRCSRRSPIFRSIPRACRSTSWCACRERRSRDRRKSIRSTSCARLPWRAS